MPIYEYRCQSCGAVSEIWEGVGTRRDPIVCKKCGENALEKVLSISHAVKNSRPKGATCCGREERCDKPPCSSGSSCQRD
jgi:putative FmdB family regulatory protein